MTILLIVADGSRARLFTTQSQRGEIEPWRELEHAASRLRGQDLTSDAAGRDRDASGQGRHGMVDERKAHWHEEQVFAREICKLVDSRLKAGDISKIYLVAPARFLGYLRLHLSEQARQVLVAEQVHDLVALPAREIRAHLPERL